MIYDVSETRYFEIKNIKEILNYNFELKRIKVMNNIVYYDLNILLTFLNSENEKLETILKMPVEFNILNEEELNVNVKNIKVELHGDLGVDLEFDLIVDIEEKNVKKEIEETYEEELITNLNRVEEEMIVDDEIENTVVVITEEDTQKFNLNKVLVDSYDTYKVLSLSDEATFNKISLMYNISMEELYLLKKEGKRVIVCAK